MSQLPPDALPGVHVAPNIQTAPDVYEIENLAADPEGRIEDAMQTVANWRGKDVLDLGAGTGFHLPRFHTLARHVFGVEPHARSRLRAMRRAVELGLERVSILNGSAEQLPLRDHSIDICHARFAYFFAPDCEPGLIELERVMRPGGTAFVIDNDLQHGTFARWLREHPAWQAADGPTIEAFWQAHGWSLTRIASAWRFGSRADLEAVVRLEFGDSLAARLLREHQGLSVDYHYCLYHRTYRERDSHDR